MRVRLLDANGEQRCIKERHTFAALFRSVACSLVLATVRPVAVGILIRFIYGSEDARAGWWILAPLI